VSLINSEGGTGESSEVVIFLHLTNSVYLEDYKLQLTFNNGVVKVVDLHDELYGEVFEPLQEISFFKQVVVNEETNTIEWPNGADFAPEFLYEIGIEDEDEPES
jgi:hypothetical protein